VKDNVGSQNIGRCDRRCVRLSHNVTTFLSRQILRANGMTSASDRITTLLAWCSANGIKIDPRLCIEHDAQTEITVFSGDAHIPDSVTRKTSLIFPGSCNLLIITS